MDDNSRSLNITKTNNLLGASAEADSAPKQPLRQRVIDALGSYLAQGREVLGLAAGEALIGATVAA